MKRTLCPVVALVMTLGLGAISCRSSSDSIVVVHVEVDADVPNVFQLRAAFADGVAVEHDRLFPAALQTTPIVFPTAFAVTLPRSRTDVLEISLVGLGAGAIPAAAHGDGSVAVIAGGTASVTIRLHAGAALCGNGQLDPGEECDLGIPPARAGCDILCHLGDGTDAGGTGGAGDDGAAGAGGGAAGGSGGGAGSTGAGGGASSTGGASGLGGGGGSGGGVGTGGAGTAGAGGRGGSGGLGTGSGGRNGTGGAGTGTGGTGTGGTGTGGAGTGGAGTGGAGTGGAGTGGAGTGGAGTGGAGTGGAGTGGAGAGSCNNNVLLLGDTKTATNAGEQAALTALGLTVTLVDSGALNYAGTPVATSFGAIIVSLGNNTAIDMPAPGQTAIVDANTAGRGVVFTDPTGVFTAGHWATLQPLTLVTASTNVNGNAMPTYTLTATGHPIWTGLATTFTITGSVGIQGGVLTNGGTAIASLTASAGTVCPTGTTPCVAVAVRETAGRIVHIQTSPDFSSSTWYTDTNLVTLVANAAKWAGHCL